VRRWTQRGRERGAPAGVDEYGDRLRLLGSWCRQVLVTERTFWEAMVALLLDETLLREQGMALGQGLVAGRLSLLGWEPRLVGAAGDPC